MLARSEDALGAFLKDRRAKLDPAALGFPMARRRTPGLRREEVAQRASVSVTWYTWLEQGRGGAPSADVLERVASALMLTAAEREHLFFLGLSRPPDVHYTTPEPVTPRLQRMLDSLELSPAFVKTPAWDIVAWNHAAATVLTDYGTLPPRQRNILRLLFDNPHARTISPFWESHARLVVASFRLETSRAGTSENARALVDELRRSSPEFASMWLANDVSTFGEGIKHLAHPITGPLALKYSSFSIDDHPNLGLVIYTPATPADMEHVKLLVGR